MSTTNCVNSEEGSMQDTVEKSTPLSSFSDDDRKSTSVKDDDQNSPTSDSDTINNTLNNISSSSLSNNVEDNHKNTSAMSPSDFAVGPIAIVPVDSSTCSSNPTSPTNHADDGNGNDTAEEKEIIELKQEREPVKWAKNLASLVCCQNYDCDSCDGTNSDKLEEVKLQEKEILLQSFSPSLLSEFSSDKLFTGSISNVTGGTSSTSPPAKSLHGYTLLLTLDRSKQVYKYQKKLASFLIYNADLFETYSQSILKACNTHFSNLMKESNDNNTTNGISKNTSFFSTSSPSVMNTKSFQAGNQTQGSQGLGKHPLSESISEVVSSFILFGTQTQALAISIKGSVARPLLNNSQKMLSTTDLPSLSTKQPQSHQNSLQMRQVGLSHVSSSYQKSRESCVRSRKDALKQRNKYCKALKECEILVKDLKSRLAKQQTANNTLTPSEKRTLHKYSEKLLQSIGVLKTQQISYQILVDEENKLVKYCSKLEKKTFDYLQTAEESRLRFLLDSLEKICNFEKSSLEKAVGKKGDNFNTEEYDEPINETEVPDNITDKETDPNETTQGIQEAQTHNLPIEVGQMRDKMKELMSLHQQKSQIVRSVSTFCEDLACASELFSNQIALRLASEGYSDKKSFRSGLSSDKDEKKNLYNMISLVEGDKVQQRWVFFLDNIIALSRSLSELSIRIRKYNHMLLDPLLMRAESDYKYFIEGEELRWNQLVDASKQEQKAKLKRNTCIAKTEKARERLDLSSRGGISRQQSSEFLNDTSTENTSSDKESSSAPRPDGVNSSSSSSDNISGNSKSTTEKSNLNPTMRKALGNMFSILPKKGEEAMAKMLNPEHRQAIAHASFNEAESKLEKMNVEYQSALDDLNEFTTAYLKTNEGIYQNFVESEQKFVCEKISNNLNELLNSFAFFRDERKAALSKSLHLFSQNGKNEEPSKEEKEVTLLEGKQIDDFEKQNNVITNNNLSTENNVDDTSHVDTLLIESDMEQWIAHAREALKSKMDHIVQSNRNSQKNNNVKNSTNSSVTSQKSYAVGYELPFILEDSDNVYGLLHLLKLLNEEEFQRKQQEQQEGREDTGQDAKLVDESPGSENSDINRAEETPNSQDSQIPSSSVTGADVQTDDGGTLVTPSTSTSDKVVDKTVPTDPIPSFSDHQDEELKALVVLLKETTSTSDAAGDSSKATAEEDSEQIQGDDNVSEISSSTSSAIRLAKKSASLSLSNGANSSSAETEIFLHHFWSDKQQKDDTAVSDRVSEGEGEGGETSSAANSNSPQQETPPTIIESFSCAYFPLSSGSNSGGSSSLSLTPLLHHGRMFITAEKMYFIGWGDKKVMVDWKDVTNVTKEPYMMIDNNLRIHTSIPIKKNDSGDDSSERNSNIINESHNFGSFTQREKCYQTILKLTTLTRSLNELSGNKNNDETPNSDDGTKESEIVVDLEPVPPDQILDKMEIVVDKKMYNVSVDKLHEICFSDEGKESGFYLSWLEKSGSFDVTVGEWDTNDTKNDWCGEIYTKKRTINFKFKRTTHLYIGPPVASVIQTQYCRVEGNDKCIIATNVRMEGIPYADVFNVEVRMVASREGTSNLQVKAGLFVDFKKKTMLKSKIKAGTLSESTPVYKRLYEAMRVACCSGDGEVDDKTESEAKGNIDKESTSSSSLVVESANGTGKNSLMDMLNKYLPFLEDLEVDPMYIVLPFVVIGVLFVARRTMKLFFSSRGPSSFDDVSTLVSREEFNKLSQDVTQIVEEMKEIRRVLVEIHQTMLAANTVAKGN